MVQEYYSHPLLRKNSLVFRQYQQDIVKKTLYKNSLVVIPTSLGKTIIALLICLDVLLHWKNSKILILAPTRPLVFQHFNLFKKHTPLASQCIALTGKIAPEIRKVLWASSGIRLYFATPELVNNDINNNFLKRNEFYLIVYDEAQRAVKDYSYTRISSHFYENAEQNDPPLVLGLSASPGSTEDKIKEICVNLFIEQIISRSERDHDVFPYVYDTNVECYNVTLDRYHLEISELLTSMIHDNINWLIKNKLLKKKRADGVYKKDLLSLREYITSHLDPKNTNLFLITALKYQSLSMILLYCRDLIESQGAFALRRFLDNSRENSAKSYNHLFLDTRLQKIESILNENANQNEPKLMKLLLIVEKFLKSELNDVIDHNYASPESDQNNNAINSSLRETSIIKESISPIAHKKVLIFSQYRDTLEEITTFLEENGIKCSGFYGQSSRNGIKGLSQDKQLSILDDFREGKFPVLVATSVAEEGLNIPNVDLVVFYEPVPSEIRFIQRKGRTGRFANGKVVILVSDDSIDTKYLEASKRKLSKMRSSLQNANFSLAHYKKRSFDNFERMIDSDISTLYTNSEEFLYHGKGKGYDKSNFDVAIASDNPIFEHISSNSNKKIKNLVKRLSYNYPKSKTSEHANSSITTKNLEDLYEVSLSLDRKKIVQRVQRQILVLLGEAGRAGLEISSLEEQIYNDGLIVKEAIDNLKKMKRVVLLNKNTLALTESTKFIPGNKYFMFIEKVMIGKAVVRVNDKWYASLDHHDYFGPRSLLKKGNSLEVIGEMYKRAGVLHLIVKKIL
ncbi:helicase-related protein [Candidatus Nitrosocosmicus hydrocola]|uniref:helicase-related protein n=1 Tax=Candidatus Nitrosocosmicus hydrocola TaxID=1826872 RepID=UPI0011E5D1FD|nr:helicase-related protein [Candidatus Nitrosocosmicus hydrocola]